MINTMRRFIDHRKHRNDTETPRAVSTRYTDKKSRIDQKRRNMLYYSA